jgi:hypothetical protein
VGRYIDRRRRGVNSRRVSLCFQESWYGIHASRFPSGRTEFAIGECSHYAERGAGAHGDQKASAAVRERASVVAGADAP